jgi:hypothetical protein
MKENDERLCQHISERDRRKQLQYGNYFMYECYEKDMKIDERSQALLFSHLYKATESYSAKKEKRTWFHFNTLLEHEENMFKAQILA